MGDGILFRLCGWKESSYFRDLGVDSVFGGYETFYACGDGGVDYGGLEGSGECCDGGDDGILIGEGGEEGGRAVVCADDGDGGGQG